MGIGKLLRRILPFALIAIPFIGQGLVAAGILGGAATAATVGGGAAAFALQSAYGGGTLAAATGATFAGAAGGGVAATFGSAARSLLSGVFGGGAGTSSGLATAFRVGGTALNIFGSLSQGRAQAEFFRSQQEIAALNSAQIKELLPLQLEAYEKEIVSIGESVEIRERDIAELRKRANRQGAFTFEGLERAESLNLLGEAGIRERSQLASSLVTSQLGIIISRAAEKTRQIDVQQERLAGGVSQLAARGGTRVGGGSVETVREEVRFEAGQATEEVQRERDQALTETALQEQARLSQEQEQLSTLLLRNEELEQQRRETQRGLEDAVFDANIELEITQRNASIAVDRVEFNKELAKKRADIEGLQQDILERAAAKRARIAVQASTLSAAAIAANAKILQELTFGT